MAMTYVVTGASRGIGLEFCRQLAKRGERVIGIVRSATAALTDMGVRTELADVTIPAQVHALGQRLAGEAVDVLINNAGVSSKASKVTELTIEELGRVFAVNASSPMVVTGALLESLRAGKARRVVNISSQLGSIANNTGGSSYPYRASKAALNMLTVSLANELRPEGFTCITMHPGWVQTDMGGPNATLTPLQAVTSMLHVLDRTGPDDSGKFLNYDGKILPW
ncbi:MAG: SDR family oxidoreductase [Phycisphaerales bacterium]|jgi:NAD(P)-dependent dehydrogenase (short-subunit alcohol dehydrogenase family)